MRGRKPKPPGLALVHGDTRDRGSRRHGQRAQVAREAGGGTATAPPPELGAEARRYWKHLRPALEARGDLTPRDRNAFARYCELLVTFWRLSDLIDERGVLVESGGYLVEGKDGEEPRIIGAKLRTNPALTARNTIAGRLLQLEGEFGLAPTARMRLGATEPQPPTGSGSALLERLRRGSPRAPRKDKT